MAQWKRAGPITQRSEDQNLALLLVFFLLKGCLRTLNLLLFTYFPPIKLKKNDATKIKISIGYIWPCRRIGVRKWKAKLYARYSYFKFGSYETKFFKMNQFVTKWGTVPWFRLWNLFYKFFFRRYWLIEIEFACSQKIIFKCLLFQAKKLENRSSQSAGFEPARGNPNGFLVHHLDHSAITTTVTYSATFSSQMTLSRSLSGDKLLLSPKLKQPNFW